MANWKLTVKLEREDRPEDSAFRYIYFFEQKIKNLDEFFYAMRGIVSTFDTKISNEPRQPEAGNEEKEK